MTPSQEKTIAKLREELPLVYDSARTGTYELKKFEVTERDGYLAVMTVVGLIGDEGTLAVVLARENRLIAVGPRGSVMLLNAKKKSAKNGWHNVKYAERTW